MKFELFQKLLPLIIFSLPILMAVKFPKTLFVTLPIFVGGLYVYFPNSTFFQIPIAILWVLMLIGNTKVLAYSKMDEKTSKFLSNMLNLLEIIAAIILFFVRYPYQQINTIQEFLGFIITNIAMGILIGLISYLIIIYIICPLFVLQKEEINTTILDYYKISEKKNSGSFAIFKEDDEIYRLNPILFKKFRNKVGNLVSYVKYTCPFGVCVIGKLKIEDTTGQPSEWEKFNNDNPKKSSLSFKLIFIIGMILFLLQILEKL